MTNSPSYTLKMSDERTYEDGFAEGYSRAWQECWEYMRELTQAEIKDEVDEFVGKPDPIAHNEVCIHGLQECADCDDSGAESRGEK